MKNKRKRIIALILSAAIFLCNVPVTALAEEIEEPPEQEAVAVEESSSVDAVIEEKPPVEVIDTPQLEAEINRSEADNESIDKDITGIPLVKPESDPSFEDDMFREKLLNVMSGKETFSEEYANSIQDKDKLLAYALACCKLNSENNLVTKIEDNRLYQLFYTKPETTMLVKDLPNGAIIIDENSRWANDYGIKGDCIKWVKMGSRNCKDIDYLNVGDVVPEGSFDQVVRHVNRNSVYTESFGLAGKGTMLYARFSKPITIKSFSSPFSDYTSDETFMWLNFENINLNDWKSPMFELSDNLKNKLKLHSYYYFKNFESGNCYGNRLEGLASYITNPIYSSPINHSFPEFFKLIECRPQNQYGIYGVAGRNTVIQHNIATGSTHLNCIGSNNDNPVFISGNNLNMYGYYICIDENSEVYSIPNNSNQYILVPSNYCDTPTLYSSVDSVGRTVLHAVCEGASKLILYKDDEQLVSSSNSTIVQQAVADGEYYVVAKNGDYEAKSNTVTVTGATVITPEITPIYTDSATPYGDNITVSFKVEDEGAKTSSIASVTVVGNKTGNIPVTNKDSIYSFTTEANDSFTITAENTYGNSDTKAINVSKVDKEAPLLSVLPSTTTATNKPITLAITASDSGSGIKEITLPNGGKYAGTTTNYEVSSNGEYIVTASDNTGKEKTVTLNIGNLDFELPTIDVDISTTDTTKEDIVATVTASDNIAVDYIALPDGSKINATTASFTIESNGSFTFKVVDKAGNENSKTIVVDNLDKDAPTIVVVKSTEEYTNQPVTLFITATDINGVDKITLPDGSDVQGGTAEYVVETNGSFAISATDSLGTRGKQDIIIDNIDKVNPTVKITPSTTDYVKDGVKVNIQGFDNREVDKIVLEDGTEIKGSKADIFVTENKTVKATVYDKSKNFVRGSLEVSNIDSNPPTLTYSYDDTVTKGNVEVTVATEDDIGIKGIKLPNGVFVTSTKATFTADKNGSYTCTAVDHVDNETPIDIVISCIDRTAPTIEKISITPVGKMKGLFTGSDVTVSAVANDNVEINHIEYRVVGIDTNFKPYTAPLLFDMDINTTVEFIAYDTASNASEKVTSDKIEVDKTAPTISYTLSTEDLTKDDVLITVVAKDNKAVKSIKLPDGSMVEADTAVFTATENGDYSFIAYDTVGNASNELIVKIRNIDKELPTAEFIYDSTPTRESLEVTVKASDNKGIKSITLPDGTIVNSATAKFTVDKNGVYEVKIEDIVGNIAKASVTINNFDFEKPVITAVKLDEAGLLTRLLTNKSVKLSVEATDDTEIALYEYKLVNAENEAVKDWTNLGGASGVIANKDFDGIVLVRVTDGVGNMSEESTAAFTLDVTPPSLTYELSTNMPTDKPILLTIKAKDNVGVKSITLPNGNIAEKDVAHYIIRDNGKYHITVTDMAGTDTTETIKISNIKGYGIPEEAPFLDLDKDGKNDMLLNPPFPDGDDFVDLDGDGIDDRKDIDGDGIVDWIDSNGDGSNDLESPWLDLDGDGKNDLLLPPNPSADDLVDLNGDGIDDRKDIDGDGIVDWIDFDGDGINDYIDTDGDGKPDFIDKDNDGKNDIDDVFIDLDGDGKNDILYNTTSSISVVAETDGAEVTIKSDSKAYVLVPTRILDEKDVFEPTAEYQTFVLNKDGSITNRDRDSAELQEDSTIKVLAAYKIDNRDSIPTQDENTTIEENPFGDRVCFKIIKEGTHELIIRDSNDNEKIVPVTVKFNEKSTSNSSGNTGSGSSHTEVITKEVQVPVEIPIYIEKPIYVEKEKLVYVDNPVENAESNNVAKPEHQVVAQTSGGRVERITSWHLPIALVIVAGTGGYFIGSKSKKRED